MTRSVAPYSRLLLPPVKALGWRQPIAAGWAYQFIAQIGFVRESWTAPLDVARLRPAQDANQVAAEQVKAFVRLSPKEKGDTFPCSSSTPSLRSREAAAGA